MSEEFVLKRRPWEPEHMAAIGRLGGQSRSEKKREAVRANGSAPKRVDSSDLERMQAVDLCRGAVQKCPVCGEWGTWGRPVLLTIPDQGEAAYPGCPRCSGVTAGLPLRYATYRRALGGVMTLAGAAALLDPR